MIAASTKLRQLVLVYSVHRGMVTCGTWYSQAARESHTAHTALAPPTPQNGVVGLLTPSSTKKVSTQKPRIGITGMLISRLLVCPCLLKLLQRPILKGQ